MEYAQTLTNTKLLYTALFSYVFQAFQNTNSSILSALIHKDFMSARCSTIPKCREALSNSWQL